MKSILALIGVFFGVLVYANTDSFVDEMVLDAGVKVDVQHYTCGDVAATTEIVRYRKHVWNCRVEMDPPMTVLYTSRCDSRTSRAQSSVGVSFDDHHELLTARGKACVHAE